MRRDIDDLSTATVGAAAASTTKAPPISRGPARLPAANPATAVFVFGWRTALRMKHVPEQLFDLFAIPVVFTLLFTYLFGGALAGSPRTYLQSLLPGTMVMTVLLLTTFTGANLTTDRSSGAFDRFRSLPIWRPAPIVGALLGDLWRYTLASAIVVGLGLIMGFRPQGGSLGVIAALGLSLAFAHGVSWIWVVVGLVARTPTSVTTSSVVVLFPLTLASNAFVDPETLPRWLERFVEVNPVSHLVTAARGLMHGDEVGSEVLTVIAVALALVLVVAPLAFHVDRRHR
jgi:ABC-2 type transport system permease protein